eukprot:Em0006g1475a
MELDENVQPASSRRSYTLSKDVLPPLETLVVTIVGSTELDGELFPAAMLVEERSVANDLLAEADAMIYDLQNQLIFVRQELTEAHETLASQYCNKGGNHTIAVVKADSFVNVNGNPYPIELFLSSDMKFTLLTLGLNGADSIYDCTMHRDNRWDMSKAEAHFTNTVVRTLATLSMQTSNILSGVEKHNDDAKRNYFSSNQWDAPAEDRVQAGRAA